MASLYLEQDCMGGAHIAAAAMCVACEPSRWIKFYLDDHPYRTHGKLRHVCATRGKFRDALEPGTWNLEPDT